MQHSVSLGVLIGRADSSCQKATTARRKRKRKRCHLPPSQAATHRRRDIFSTLERWSQEGTGRRSLLLLDDEEEIESQRVASVRNDKFSRTIRSPANQMRNSFDFEPEDQVSAVP